MTHLSDSKVQREIEAGLYPELIKKFDLKELKHEKICFRASTKMEFDGYAETDTEIYLFEIYARITPPLAAQVKKVMTDTLKMHAWKRWYESEKDDLKVKPYMVFVKDNEGNSPMLDHFQKKSWQAQVFETLGVEIIAFELSESDSLKLKKAQKAQAEGMKSKKEKK